MDFRRAAAIAMCASALAGCQHALNDLESQARVDPRTVAAYPYAGEVTPGSTCGNRRMRGDAHDIAINLDCFYFPEQLRGKEYAVLAYDQAAGTTPEAKIYRKRLAAVLVKHSDDVCTKELGDISAREAITNTLLGTITSTLSTVSSIVTGERLKSWLAGGAAISSATRDHINAEVFRNVLSNAMAKAIENSRSTQLAAINTALDSTTNTYTVDDVIRDVNRYHQTCSFYNGLVLVVNAVNRVAPGIESDYRNLTAAINDIEAQIVELKAHAATASPAEKPKIDAEITKLIQRKEALVLQRSQLGVAAQGNDASKKVPNKTENN